MRIIRDTLLVCFLGAGAAHPAIADGLDIETLNEAIKTSGAQWEAGSDGFEIPMNDAVRSGHSAVFGLIPDPKSQGKSGWKPRKPNRELKAIDWRDKDGKNYLPPVRNQGKCGSCTAFAAIGLIETQINIAAGEPQLNIDLSEQNLFAQIGKCSRGSMPGSAMSVLRNTGVPDEMCQQYTSGRVGKDVSSSKACKDIQNRRYRLIGYQSIAPYNLKWALQYGPVLTTMSVYEDFKYYKSGVYKHVTGKYLGGHAVLLVGFDDSKNAWIVRNSWSERWGDKGYFLISYKAGVNFGFNSYRGIAARVKNFAKLKSGGALSSMATSTQFKVQRFADARQNNASYQARMFGDSGRFEIDFPSGQYIAGTNVQSIKDGVYTAKLVNTSALSTPSYSSLIVAKKKPELKLDVEADFNVDTAQKGKIHFYVNAAYGSIPPTHSTIVFKNEAGEIVSRSGIPNPGDRAKFSWETKNHPTGRYKVEVVHHVGDLYSYSADVLEFEAEK